MLMSSTLLNFRCPEATAAAARQRAVTDGVSLSAALRSMVADYAEGRVASVQMARATSALCRELRAVGGNLNQVARQLNSGRYPGELAEVVGRLGQVVRRLHDQLGAQALPRSMR
jgi:hypothetical protein